MTQANYSTRKFVQDFDELGNVRGGHWEDELGNYVGEWDPSKDPSPQPGQIVRNVISQSQAGFTQTGAQLFPDNPRAAAAYDKAIAEGKPLVSGGYRTADANIAAAKDAANFWVNNPLAFIEGPINDFLTSNPAGQAVAPVLANGVPVASFGGSAGPQKPFDPNIVNNAASKYPSPVLSATPPAGPNGAGAGPTGQGSLGMAGTGWSTANNSAPKTSTLSDGTQYTSSVVNGQTVYTIVASPRNPSAVGKTLDNANFDNLLSGKPFAPVAAAPRPGVTPAPTGTTPTGTPAAGGAPGSLPIDPTTAAVIGGGVISAAGSNAAAGAQAQAATDAAKLQADQFDKWLNLQKDAAAQQQTNAQPWLDAGKTALNQLGTFFTDNPDFGMSQFQADPGYGFRLSEGLKSLQNSAAARGGLLSGNTMKGITEYGQGMASQEYQNAYTRYNTNRNTKLNALQSTAGLGQTAVNQSNQASQNYVNGAGDAMVGGANALARGRTAAADANASGYMGTSNALTDALGNYIKVRQGQDFVNALRGGY